jgi:hypothetical protein
MIRKVLLLLGLLGVFTACTSSPANNTADGCPVTTSSQQSQSLPIDIEYENRFWYGTPALWTNLPSVGIWEKLPKGDSGYVQKAVFWREGWAALDEPNPGLTVSGRRLDASAPTFSFSDTTHGWDDTGDFMLVGISIPTEGCWKITAEYKDATLTYVVEVAP